MFRGRYEHAMDGKGRTSIPARFRDVLGAMGDTRLVLTSGLDPCVVAYPMVEWLAFEERLAALPQFDPTVATLRRIVLSGAVECDVDKVGRVLIPQALRHHGDLRREALWAGMGKHFELWSKEAFESMHRTVAADVDRRLEMSKRLAELGL